MNKNGYTAYKRAEIQSSSPEQLIPLLYRELLRQLAQGRTHIANGAFEEKADAFSKANAILLELMGSLDVKAGGELGQQLASLYRYFLAELEAVSRTLDLGRLDSLVDLIQPLEEAWRHAAEELASQQAGV